jgi:hypothetical protein
MMKFPGSGRAKKGHIRGVLTPGGPQNGEKGQKNGKFSEAPKLTGDLPREASVVPLVASALEVYTPIYYGTSYVTTTTIVTNTRRPSLRAVQLRGRVYGALATGWFWAACGRPFTQLLRFHV